MVQRFAQDIWLAEGPQVRAALGFHYPTRMAVIRLRGAALVLWSPVPLTPALKAQVDALGEVQHILAPNALHHLSVGDWHRAYPQALLHAAPGLRGKRPDLTIDRSLGAQPDPAWAGQIDQVLIPNRIAPEVILFHRASSTVLVTDLLQQMPRTWYRGWRALIARLDLMTEPTPQVPRKFRLAMTDRAAARQAVARLLDWPAQRLVMAHGTPLTQNAGPHLRQAFAWLTK